MKLTFGQIKEQVWRNLGEPDDLTPILQGGTVESDTYISRIVNQAQLAITTWQDPVNGRRFKWKGSKGLHFLYGEAIAGTVVAGDTWVIQVNSGLAVNEGDVVTITHGTETATRYVMNVDLAVDSIILSEDLPWTPDPGDVVNVHPTYLTITDYSILDVLKVENLTNNTELDMMFKGETDLFNITLPGNPGAWDKRGDRLYFDKPLEGRYRFRLFVNKAPHDMLTDVSLSELPSQVEMGIILKATQLGFIHMQEEVSASYAYNDTNKFMRTTQSEWDMDSDMSTGYSSSVKHE